MIDWNQKAKEIHALNAKWWHDKEGNRLERNRGELLMLVVTELAEATEGLRKNLMDDHLPYRKMIEVELSDALIRILDFAGGFGELIHDSSLFFSFNEVSKENNEAENLLLIAISVGDVYSFDNVGLNLRYAINNIMKHAEIYGYDVLGAMEEKLAYNAKRIDHTYEAREAANGKKF